MELSSASGISVFMSPLLSMNLVYPAYPAYLLVEASGREPVFRGCVEGSERGVLQLCTARLETRSLSEAPLLCCLALPPVDVECRALHRCPTRGCPLDKALLTFLDNGKPLLGDGVTQPAGTPREGALASHLTPVLSSSRMTTLGNGAPSSQHLSTPLVTVYQRCLDHRVSLQPAGQGVTLRVSLSRGGHCRIREGFSVLPPTQGLPDCEP